VSFTGSRMLALVDPPSAIWRPVRSNCGVTLFFRFFSQSKCIPQASIAWDFRLLSLLVLNHNRSEAFRRQASRRAPLSQLRLPRPSTDGF